MADQIAKAETLTFARGLGGRARVALRQACALLTVVLAAGLSVPVAAQRIRQHRRRCE